MKRRLKPSSSHSKSSEASSRSISSSRSKSYSSSSSSNSSKRSRKSSVRSSSSRYRSYSRSPRRYNRRFNRVPIRTPPSYHRRRYYSRRSERRSSNHRSYSPARRAYTLTNKRRNVDIRKRSRSYSSRRPPPTKPISSHRVPTRNLSRENIPVTSKVNDHKKGPTLPVPNSKSLLTSNATATNKSQKLNLKPELPRKPVDQVSIEKISNKNLEDHPNCTENNDHVPDILVKTSTKHLDKKDDKVEVSYENYQNIVSKAVDDKVVEKFPDSSPQSPPFKPVLNSSSHSTTEPLPTDKTDKDYSSKIAEKNPVIDKTQTNSDFQDQNELKFASYPSETIETSSNLIESKDNKVKSDGEEATQADDIINVDMKSNALPSSSAQEVQPSFEISNNESTVADDSNNKFSAPFDNLNIFGSEKNNYSYDNADEDDHISVNYSDDDIDPIIEKPISKELPNQNQFSAITKKNNTYLQPNEHKVLSSDMKSKDLENTSKNNNHGKTNIPRLIEKRQIERNDNPSWKKYYGHPRHKDHSPPRINHPRNLYRSDSRKGAPFYNPEQPNYPSYKPLRNPTKSISNDGHSDLRENRFRGSDAKIRKYPNDRRARLLKKPNSSPFEFEWKHDMFEELSKEPGKERKKSYFWQNKDLMLIQD